MVITVTTVHLAGHRNQQAAQCYAAFYSISCAPTLDSKQTKEGKKERKVGNESEGTKAEKINKKKKKGSRRERTMSHIISPLL